MLWNFSNLISVLSSERRLVCRWKRDNPTTCDKEFLELWCESSRRLKKQRRLLIAFSFELSNVAKFFSLRNPNERRSVAQNCENCWIKNTDSKRRSADFFILSLRTFVGHVCVSWCTLIYRFQFLFLFFAWISLLLFVGREHLALKP